jgi:uncharacterized repeat protein (TIGR03803 family)
MSTQTIFSLALCSQRKARELSTSLVFWLLRIAFVVLPCLLMTIAASGQTFTLLTSFDGSDASTPVGIVQGTDGNFYGTTTGGGANGNGTIFEMTPAGTLTTLHSFNNGNEGSVAPNGLIQGTDGKFYGTTYGGGTGTNCTLILGCGTVFSIVPEGSLTTLYNFCSQASCADGFAPAAALIQGSDGNFYGTTSGIAQGSSCPGNCGTVFKITPAGVLTTLYTFDGTAGYGPNTALVQGTDGNFYGTTAFGGNRNCGSPPSCGTIFKITPTGTLTTLYRFCSQTNCPDGFDPNALVQGTDGSFYGTTALGGNPSFYLFESYGTVFKITPSGALTTLHLFDAIDGQGPNFILQASDGNFYGTTSGGGEGCGAGGTIFKMTPQGTLITLFSFAYTTGCGGGSGVWGNGQSPSDLLQATSGAFYGTAAQGGINFGTVFSLLIGVGGTTPSTTNLSLSPTTVTVDMYTPVLLTATVVPASGTGTPTGVVEFFSDAAAIGSAELSSGTANFTYGIIAPTVTTYQITAAYSGDATFAMSTSPAQTLTVSPLPAAATPTFSPAAGTYNSAQAVTISDSTAGATIYFTNDGTAPTASSAIYSSPIAVNSTQTVMAMATASGYNNSSVASASYTISLTPDYQLSVNPSSLSMVAGQSATATFTVTPVNGFNSAVSFTCGNLPAEAACTFNPPSVTPSGGSAVSSTLTVSTTAASAALRGLRPSSHYPIYAFFVPCLGMFCNVALRRKRAHRGLRVFGMFSILMLAAGLISCGSNSSPRNSGTPPGTTTATITASTAGTGAISHNATLTITITQ